MRTLHNTIRAALAASLLAAASLAMAASPYTVQPLNGTGEALGPNGQIFGVDTSGNLYITGPNATGVTNLGSNINAWGPVANNSVFALPSWNDWQSVAPSTWGYNGGPVNAPASITGTNTSAYGSNPVVYGGYINGSGAIAANLNIAGEADAPLEGNFGAVRNANGSITYLGGGTYVAGINASGTVVYTGAPVQTYTGTPLTAGWNLTVTGGAITTLAAGSITPKAIADLGFGGVAGGINATGQVTGGLNTEALASGNYDPRSWMFNTQYPANQLGWDANNNPLVPTKAFRTGANGVGETVFGTGPGISSMGLAINASGQVGGYFTLASGQTEGFITTARGTSLVGIGAGAAGDSTQVDFLNSLGQAIVQDTTTNTWYLYNAGVVTDVATLAGGSAFEGDPVAGLNDAGQILLADPDLLSVIDTSQLTANVLVNNYGGVDVTTTQSFTDTATSTGYAPTAGFFHDPTTSSDGDVQVYNPTTFSSPVLAPSGPTGSVPEPDALGLLAAGAALMLGLRRKTKGHLVA